jgi:PTS system glucose-specific IIC component
MINQGINFNAMTAAPVGAYEGMHALDLGNGSIAYLTQGVNPGSYMQGKFPFMMFGLPAAGAAMVMAAKKENRQVAASVIGAAALTSFLTGITEPIEFTFLFLAPVLFFGFHASMAAMSF